MDKYLTLENLRTLVGERVFEEVMALPKDTPILVSGRQGRTGKTTTVRILRNAGYTSVRELHNADVKWHPEYAIILNEMLS